MSELSKWQLLQQLAEQTQQLEEYRRKGEELTQQRADAIKQALDDGLRVSEICEATGLTRTSVYRFKG